MNSHTCHRVQCVHAHRVSLSPRGLSKHELLTFEFRHYSHLQTCIGDFGYQLTGRMSSGKQEQHTNRDSKELRTVESVQDSELDLSQPLCPPALYTDC